MTKTRTRIAASLILATAALLPSTAFAYVGPGAGLSLLGALLALLGAVAMAVLFIFAWPLRKMLRKRRAARRAAGTPKTDDAPPKGAVHATPRESSRS